MTKLKKAKRIIEQGNCSGVDCDMWDANECPAACSNLCYSGRSPEAQEACKAYIKSQETTMDKANAMARLDAIEREASELRKIIEGKTGLVYDESKIYVGLLDDQPYVMSGRSCNPNAGFVFQSFSGDRPALKIYSYPRETGQACLDYHINAGFEIRAFSDTKEALQFFIDNI